MKVGLKAAVVGGCGHVGLPLSIVLAESGIETFAFDISTAAVNMVNQGLMPFMEEDAPEKLKEVIENKNLIATTDPKSISECDYVIVVIGTPVDEYLGPNPNSVISAITDLIEYLNDSQTLILRSTIFPGVTRKVFEELKSIFPGMKIAYCPERIIEGQALSEIKTLPQIIGTYEEQSFKSAEHLFGLIGVESLFVKPEEAELAKLFTNVWRYIKFAAANQFWMMANDLNVDYEVVRRVIAYNYPRAQDLPSAGFAAGPCLFKDTMQLSALVQQNFPLGHSAMMINEGVPGYLVRKLRDQFSLKNMTIGILGMAFKGNVDDTRSSLAFKLRKQLIFEAKEVLISDPYVIDSRCISIDEILDRSDLLIIGAPHSKYKSLKTDKPIIDIWGLRNGSALI